MAYFKNVSEWHGLCHAMSRLKNFCRESLDQFSHYPAQRLRTIPPAHEPSDGQKLKPPYAPATAENSPSPGGEGRHVAPKRSAGGGEGGRNLFPQGLELRFMAAMRENFSGHSLQGERAEVRIPRNETSRIEPLNLTNTTSVYLPLLHLDKWRRGSGRGGANLSLRPSGSCGGRA